MPRGRSWGLWRRIWPFERRGRGYTDLRLDGILAAAEGAGPSRLAVAETAAGIVARAFAVAEVEGASGPIRAALPPSVLYRLGRELILAGESLHRIEVRGGRVRLLPCESWTVTGSADPETWRYSSLTVSGPSSSTAYRNTPAAAVVHCRVPGNAARPWEGASPLASIERDLLAAVVRVWRRRFADPLASGRLLAVGDERPGEVDAIRTKFREDPGRTAGVRAKARPEGAQPWRIVDLKPELDPETGGLVEAARRELLRSVGVPDGLLGSESAGAAREAIRQVLAGAVQPLGVIAAEELRAKLEAPELRLTFRRLGAADVVSKARSLKSLIESGLSLEAAARVAGIEVPEGAERPELRRAEALRILADHWSGLEP